jgi:hypothetical protein
LKFLCGKFILRQDLFAWAIAFGWALAIRAAQAFCSTAATLVHGGTTITILTAIIRHIQVSPFAWQIFLLCIYETAKLQKSYTF